MPIPIRARCPATLLAVLALAVGCDNQVTPPPPPAPIAPHDQASLGKAPFKTLARAQITGQTVGMLKLLFHRETLELLGVHCFGESAAEIVHIGQAVMGMPAPHNSIKYFVHTTFNYPTMAEAYRVAATDPR